MFNLLSTLAYMKQKDILTEKIGKDAGFRVPEGYFEALPGKIMAQLPPVEAAPAPATLTRWQRLRPYIYMAAMFAGIWCMMKIFHTVSSSPEISLSNPPEAIAMAMQEIDDPAFYIPEEFDYESLMESELPEGVDDTQDLQEETGLQLDPEYESMNIPPRKQNTQI